MSFLPSSAQNTSSSYITQYDLAFQISPIILVGGITAKAQGGISPITTYTGGPPATPEEAFASYLPLPGSTLISNAAGMYPFATQQIAANALIQQPLTLSMKMIAPVNQPGGYLAKLGLFSALQSSLEQHNATGGMYIVATPAFVFNDLVMLTMTDITDDGQQQQVTWQLDFIKPILTLAGAAAAENNFISKVSGGGQFTGTPGWSGNPQALDGSLSGVTAALATFGGTL